jgi:ABC transporter
VKGTVVEPVIVADGLTKRYGGIAVVDGVSFEVGRGEIFGILGRNGAGKTTAVECLQGLRRADGGRMRVLGLNPLTQAGGLRRRTGSQLQELAFPQVCTYFSVTMRREFCGTQVLVTAGNSERLHREHEEHSFGRLDSPARMHVLPSAGIRQSAPGIGVVSCAKVAIDLVVVAADRINPNPDPCHGRWITLLPHGTSPPLPVRCGAPPAGRAGCLAL